MKYYSASSIFKFSWDQVSSGFWKRYPNPHSNHVISEDTIQRKIVDGRLITHKIITKINKLPKWTEMFTGIFSGSREVCILEESIVDPKTKTLTTYTRNIGLTKVMTVEEKCIYKPSQDDHSWTVCHREAWINSGMKFSSIIERFGIQNFKMKIPGTIKGFEHILNKLYMPDKGQDHPKLLLSTEKIKESKEKIKESAIKTKESAKELAKKSKSASVVL